MKPRWNRNRKSRKGLSVAERQMQMAAGRPLHLPEGADPELERLLGGADRSDAGGR